MPRLDHPWSVLRHLLIKQHVQYKPYIADLPLFFQYSESEPDQNMWRRTYLVLLLIRVYFALSPSYIHPDEHFQGLEVFAGKLFVYRPVFRPWHNSGLGHLTMRLRN